MPYFTHGETKYKLILLYIAEIAEHAKTHLTRDQLYRTAILNSQMDYFTFEDAMHDLEEDGLLTELRRPYGNCFALTQSGRETLAMFEKSVPADERRKLDRYFSENQDQFRRETEIASRIEQNDDGQTELVLLITEHNRAIFTLRMQVSSEEQALELRSRWEANSESIYNYVWDALLDQPKR